MVTASGREAAQEPATTWIWRSLAVAIPWAFTAQATVNYVDFWWSIYTGWQIVTRRQLVSAQALFYTPTVEPFVGTQWLAHVLLYAIYAATGLVGVLLLRSLVITGLTVLVLFAAERRGASPRVAAAIAMLAGVLSIAGTAERPQLLAVLPFSIFALSLTQRRISRGFLLTLPPLMLFWVNVHGSFVLGLGICGLLVAGRACQDFGVHHHEHGSSHHEALGVTGEPGSRTPSRAMPPFDGELRRRVVLLAMVALATLVNPLGPRMYLYVTTLQANDYIRATANEWQPMSLAIPYGWLFLGTLTVAVTALVLSRARPDAEELLVLASFTLLAMLAVRNAVWWAIACLPVFARYLSMAVAASPSSATAAGLPNSSEASARRRATGVGRVVAIFVLVAAAMSLAPVRALLVGPEQVVLESPKSPAGIARYLRSARASGNAFGASEWTGYIAWHLGEGTLRYFADNRFEIHPAEVWEEYHKVASGYATWQDILDRYAVDWLVLDADGQKGLIPLARASPVWREMYADEGGVVFARVVSDDRARETRQGGEAR